MKLRQLIESFVIANDEFEDYLDRATEQLATEIQSGKNARDAVHDLSVQFSKMHNNAYAAYTRMSDSLFARLHTLELEGSESTDMMGGDMGPEMGPEMGADLDGGPEMLNDPMGSGMEMDIPPAEDMPMDQEMDDYNAVMANEPEIEENVQLPYGEGEGTYARIAYDYSEDWASIDIYKGHDKVDEWDGYFGANETGNPLAAKFVKMAKENGLDPMTLPLVDENGDNGKFDGKKFQWNEGVNEGWETMKPINRDKYQERRGLEGPFQTRVGKVVYYDPKEGSYYDPDTDMYMSYEEWKELDGDSPLRNEAEEQFAGWLAFYDGKKLKIRKDQANDIYNAKLKAIKHFNVPKSKQGVLAIKPAYEELNEAKQINEFVPLIPAAAAALAPHVARIAGGALLRRAAGSTVGKAVGSGVRSVAQRAMGAAKNVVKRPSTASKGGKASRRAGNAADFAAGVAGGMARAAGSSSGKKTPDRTTLAQSISRLNNSKYDKNKK